MGQEASVPQAGAQLQVIGAGLSRTGTAAFSQALATLLSGPVYHGGTQTTLGPERNIKSWIRALSHFPPHSAADRALIDDVITSQLEGFVATTDAPCSGLVAELVRLYPDAIVVCTVRDPDAWVRSMANIANTSTLWFLRAVLLPLPALRYFVDYINVLREQWVYLYDEHEPQTTKTWNNHIAYLKRTVPPERLVFFDVREGWEPLCKVLGKPIPDTPFPRVNDGQAIDNFAKIHVIRGLTRWAGMLVLVGAAATAYWMRT